MTPQEAADHMAIRSAIENYGGAVTLRDFDMMRSLFVPEATLEMLPPYSKKFEGVEAILAAIGGLLGKYEFSILAVGWTMIELDGDVARAKHQIHEEGRVKDGQSGTWLYGVYHDELVRRDGQWLFKTRVFHPLAIDRSPAPGVVYTA